MDINATELNHHSGHYIDKSFTEEVVIKRSGRPVSIMYSYDGYMKMKDMAKKYEELEDMYWVMRANEAEKEDPEGIVMTDELWAEIFGKKE